MTIDRSLKYLQSLLKELCSLPQETEWVEFKHNNDDVPLMGEYISALANSAALLGKQSAYIVWGIDNTSQQVVGTKFKPSVARYKSQELESWLLQKITPKIQFHFFEFLSSQGLPVVILEIQAAAHRPVKFDNREYIRVGSYKKFLAEFPEKERELWRTFDKTPIERQFVVEDLDSGEVLQLLDYPSYFELVGLPLPESREGILNALEADDLIKSMDSGHWKISYLGGILFAKKLQDFKMLARKAVRIIWYKGNSRVETIREIEGTKGYAVGFEGMIDYLKNMLPSNEEIGKAFRKEVPMYPELAIRELIANAIIHQDFSLTGTGPMVEIFASRMEITNPGIPLVDTERFLDSPPRSRNEAIASFMRRINICEERGSGIDKVVSEVELYQLPAPIFEKTNEHTRVTLFAYKDFKDMESEDKIRACYQHCCLKYVNREPMNNSSVRERFNLEEMSSATASRVIKLTVDTGLIRLYDPDANRKFYRYIPYWA